MTDRKKLEEAIVWARKATHPPYDPNFAILAEAAEAHLASLPKPMWKVRVTRYPGGTYEFYEWPSQSEALVDASGHLARGAIKVEIEAP